MRTGVHAGDPAAALTVETKVANDGGTGKR